MYRPDNSGLPETALRRVLARRRAPASLRGRVMSSIRAEPARPVQAARFTWPRLHAGWAIGTCAAAVAGLLALLVGPPGQDRPDAEAAAVRVAELELAEALQLAGLNWNKAQEAALSPIQGNHDD